MPGRETHKRRTRRRPEDAEAEIAAAAEGLLRRVPLHALTVSAIMRETTLSRNAFYVYFADRYELLARVMKPVLDRLDRANALFREGGGDLVEDGRSALRQVAEICREEGPILRAVREASAYDADARAIWEGISDTTVGAFSERVTQAIAEGTMLPVDPEPTIRALIGMDLSVLLSEPDDSSDADWARLVEALLVIWSRTLLPPGRDLGRTRERRRR
ncbi:MAG: TetR/AcrR family transcriptional regulator [Thermoleophilaceae bacterium]